METEKKHRGRPVVEGSTRQIKLAAQAAKLANGESVSRGRPSNPNSARQTKITNRLNKIAAGFEIKRGRPKMNPVVELVEA